MRGGNVARLQPLPMSRCRTASHPHSLPMNLRLVGDALEVGMRPFPSPRPSPQGRGRIVHQHTNRPTRSVGARDWMRGPLSPGERAGVRGNSASHGTAPCLGSGAHSAQEVRGILSLNLVAADGGVIRSGGHDWPRSAEFYSAVSRNCNPQGLPTSSAPARADALPNAIRRYSRVQLCATSPGGTLESRVLSGRMAWLA